MIGVLCGLCLQPLPMMLCWQGSSSSCSLYLHDPLMKTSPLASQRVETGSNQYQLGREKTLYKLSIQNFRPQSVSLSSGCQRLERSLLCLCLIWQPLPSIIRCQQNMGTMRSLPSLFVIKLVCSCEFSLLSWYAYRELQQDLERQNIKNIDRKLTLSNTHKTNFHNA